MLQETYLQQEIDVSGDIQTRRSVVGSCGICSFAIRKCVGKGQGVQPI